MDSDGDYIGPASPWTIQGLSGETITRVDMTIGFYGGNGYVSHYRANHGTLSNINDSNGGGFSFIDVNSTSITINCDSDDCTLQIKKVIVYYSAGSSSVAVNVTFNGNGGKWGEDATKEVTVNSGEHPTAPNGLTKEGYTFAGWYESATPSESDNAVELSTISVTTTLYAKWTATSYTIVYDLDGGSVADTNPTSYTIETSTFSLNNPTKENYTFAGWTGSNGDTPQTSVSIAEGSTGEKSYRANWTAAAPTTYNVTIASGITNGSVSANHTTAAAGDTVTLTVTPDANYELDTLTVTDANSNSVTVTNKQFTMPEANVTVNATFKETTSSTTNYTVTFDSKGGSSVASATVESGNKVSKPTNPTRSGYTFSGWYTDEAYTSEYNFEATVTDSFTLYAKWEEDTVPPSTTTYTVTFDSKGGSAVASATVESGNKVSKPTNPTRSGYTFAGWYTDVAYTIAYNFDTAVTGNLTLYAKWTSSTPYVPYVPSNPTTPTPTTAPTVSPTTAPTVNPTTAPTTAPTSAPTAEAYTVPVSNENTVDISVNISEGNAVVQEITQADLDKITEASSESGNSGDNKVDDTKISVDVSGAKSEVTSVELSSTSIETIAKTVEANEKVDTVEIKMTNATVELDSAAVSAISEQKEGNTVKLVVENKEQAKLNDTQKESLKNFTSVQPFQAYFESAGKEIHDFKGGKATVSIKFTPETGKDVKHYHMYYVPLNGIIERYVTRYLDGMLSFVTTHFSDYAIVYDETVENETGKEDTTPSPTPGTAPTAEPTETAMPTGTATPSTAPTAKPSETAMPTGTVTPTKQPSATATPAPAVSAEEKATAALDLNAGLKVIHKGKTATVQWGKVDGADFYRVYAGYCGGKVSLVKTVKGNAKCKITIKKLNGKSLSCQTAD